MTPEEKQNAKDRIIDWVLAQGVSTVLLAFIAVGAWFGIPGYAASLRQTIIDLDTKHREERSESIKIFTEQREKDRELIRELLTWKRSVQSQTNN